MKQAGRVIVRALRRARPGLIGLFLGLGALAGSPAALAAGGGKPATKLIHVVDTRAIPPGFTRWVGEVYNDNLLLFGLLVVVVMAGMGVVLGLAFDRALGWLGIDLGRIEHHE